MTGDRPTTDGGETAAPMDIERAGDAPPEPPTNDGLVRELPDLLGDADDVSTAYLVRARLSAGSGRPVGERLVDALADEVAVVGSTLEAGFDPADPELDVLVETDHDAGAIAASLATAGPVEGVVVADVTAAAERELEANDGAADTADANDVFNELKDEVGQEGYGTVVDELEDVSFPGGPDPDEEIDLEEEVGVELTDEGTIDLGGDDGTADSGGDVTADSGDDGTLDLEDDELTTRQLLGEDERDADGEIKAPDEKAIEAAIEEVDLDDRDDATGRNGDDATERDGDDTTGRDDGEAARGADDGNKPTDTPGETGDARAADAAGAGDEPGARVDSGATGDAGAGDETGATDDAADDGRQSVDAPGATTATAGSGTAGAVPDDMDTFVAQLVDALESGAIDEQRRTELREALGIESTHSLDVRLEYLQKRVDNLAAYTDAWEAFLSEEGSGRAFMESVREDLDAIEDRLAGLEDGGGDLDGIEQRLAEIESTLAAVEQRHDEDVARLDTRMDSVESKLGQRIDAVESAVSTIREKVTSLLQWREHIDDVLGSRQ